jgi:hypothetical protein
MDINARPSSASAGAALLPVDLMHEHSIGFLSFSRGNRCPVFRTADRILTGTPRGPASLHQR